MHSTRRSLIRKTKISEAELKARTLKVVQTFIGPEEDYLKHLDWVLESFLKK
jgi:hypothetical protein